MPTDRPVADPPDADRTEGDRLPPLRPSSPVDAADAFERYNAPPSPIGFEDDDPLSPAYARSNIDETPETILHFWFGYVADRPALLAERNLLWFCGAYETDRMIANRFWDILARLASGLAPGWAARGPRQRLAAVVALDQFSRNMFRGTAAAFENDPLALRLALEGLAKGDDRPLAAIERSFLYLPLTHSESSTHQRMSVELSAQLAAEAPEPFRPYLERSLDFARRHAAIIRRFGQFPHRNALLGRISSSQEIAFLKKPGSRF